MQRSLVVAGAALVVAVLLFPTMGTPLTDDRDEKEGVVLAPSDGPNGIYAELDVNDELRLNLSERNQDLAGDGVNDHAETSIDRIFTITNEKDEPAEVWLETSVDGAWFYQGTDRRTPLNQDFSAHLETDETVSVGLFIDTTVPDHGIEEMSEFTVYAVPIESEDEEADGEPTTDDDTTTDQQTESSPEESDADQTPDPPSDEPDDQTDDEVEDTDEQTGNSSEEERSEDTDGEGGDETTDGTGEQTEGTPADEETDDSDESSEDDSETESSGTGSELETGGEGAITGTDSFGGDEEALGGVGLWVLLTLLVAAVVGALSTTVIRRGFG